MGTTEGSLVFSVPRFTLRCQGTGARLSPRAMAPLLIDEFGYDQPPMADLCRMTTERLDRLDKQSEEFTAKIRITIHKSAFSRP